MADGIDGQDAVETMDNNLNQTATIIEDMTTMEQQ